MKPSTSHFHSIRGLRYHVRTWGAARHPKLFLLHGWMDVSASFQFLVDALERDWHVIAPDWRGFGLTQWSAAGYWFPDYYADLDCLLDLYQADAPVNLVGHSMGGNIATTYAGLRPERVAMLVTLEGIGMPRIDAAKAPERILKWMDAQRDPPRFRPYASFAEVAERLKRNNPRLADEKARFLARHWAREEASGVVHMLSDPRHKAANPYLFRIEESLACWRRITAPTLLVTGKRSHIVAWLKDVPEELAERKAAFRELTEIELEDCGHMMHHDQPARLGRLIEKFLTETSRRRGKGTEGEPRFPPA
jgi:pimeloyl-ACP methyl ester carboxylesterase